MKRSLLPLLLLILTAAALTHAQNPTPTPDEKDVVKISTNLIQVDVTVTDAKGNVVRDLRPEEIQIYENGQPQKITNFSFVSNTRTREEKAETKRSDVPLPPVNLRADQVRRTIALVVDDITLSFESAHFVRLALKKFVDEQMQDGDLVAIIKTSGGIGALQQFTSDRRQLYAAIERIRWYPRGNSIGAFDPINGPIDLGPYEPDPIDSGAGDRLPEAVAKEFDQYRKDVFATGTLGALSYVLRGMQELPGRKSVVMLSDGFKLISKDASGSQDVSQAFNALQNLVAEANRASVVFYTIDPRGLQALTFNAEDQPNTIDPNALGSMLDERRRDFADTQDSLVYLARQTGGFAVINSNDIPGGIRRILDDQSYYLIAYEPESDTFDPKTRRFNRLDVRVTRPGTKVRYRSGFFNVPDGDAAARPPRMTPAQQLANAVTSPFAVNDIVLRLNPLFADDRKHGTFVRSLLHISARDLKFTDQPDGGKKAVFDVLAACFGENGFIEGQLGRSYTVTVKPADIEKVLRSGFVYQFSFPVKKPGPYQYRVAIRDGQSGKVGSVGQFIEVPNLKKDVLTVSGIVLENNTPEQWKNLSEGVVLLDGPQTNPLNDTALRRFRPGSVLRYGFEVYNAKLGADKTPQLTSKIRIFRDGKLILDGRDNPFITAGQPDNERLKFTGAISLGSAMTPGDYVLQVVVTDALAKDKRRIATQFVQFEVADKDTL